MMALLCTRKEFFLHLRLLRFTSYNSHWNFSSEDKDNLDAVSKWKFKLFKNEESPIILDMEEELSSQNQLVRTVRENKIEEKMLKRGLTGVFDIQELVSYLKLDNAKDIFVVKVPEELKYVDYFVVVSGKSQRHILGLAEYIKKIFKRKMHSYDTVPVIEGKNSSGWIAMDLGNIALHIMSYNARERYDLESLWTLGSEYDLKLNQEDDEIIELIKKHATNLDNLRPLETF